MKTEKRVVTHNMELREEGEARLFIGRPIVYDSWSEPISGMFRERIRPGAFDEWLATDPDIIACIDHDTRKLLGRTSSGTLRLRADESGLTAEVDRPNVSYANDLAESIRRGDIRGMSFVFECMSDEWYRQEGEHCRDVVKARLYEVSAVVFPAYPETQVAMRSLEQFNKDSLTSKIFLLKTIERDL